MPYFCMINNDAKVLLLLLTRKKNVLKRYNAALLPLSSRLHISLIINTKRFNFKRYRASFYKIVNSFILNKVSSTNYGYFLKACKSICTYCPFQRHQQKVLPQSFHFKSRTHSDYFLRLIFRKEDRAWIAHSFNNWSPCFACSCIEIIEACRGSITTTIHNKVFIFTNCDTMWI